MRAMIIRRFMTPIAHPSPAAEKDVLSFFTKPSVPGPRIYPLKTPTRPFCSHPFYADHPLQRLINTNDGARSMCCRKFVSYSPYFWFVSPLVV
jgi:hypothetical protein